MASEYAGLSGRERVFDLYCGIGTLSLVLALRAAEVWGVDMVEEAIADAIANARANEVDNMHFFAGDARTAIRPLAERRRDPTSSWSTRPAPASPRRWCAACSRRSRGESSTSPAIRRRWRRTRARSLTPASASLRCAPSTCSPTPHTSSASRCSSGAMA